VIGSSESCHFRTHAVQQTGYLFDQPVGGGKDYLGYGEAEGAIYRRPPPPPETPRRRVPMPRPRRQEETSQRAMVGVEWPPEGTSMVSPRQGRIERRLAAILAADVAAYSRLMGADEPGPARGAPRASDRRRSDGDQPYRLDLEDDWRRPAGVRGIRWQ
jgi:hypothetical protein